MTGIYRRLLCLYPPMFRCEFADEMVEVFQQAESEARDQGLLFAARFYCRESIDIVRGAFGERLHTVFKNQDAFQLRSRRFRMRKNFRYPIATVTMMIVTFGLVIAAIERARHVQQSLSVVRQVPLVPLPAGTFGSFVLIWLGACVACIGIWAVMHALRRSPSRRFEDVQTWPLK